MPSKPTSKIKAPATSKRLRHIVEKAGPISSINHPKEPIKRDLKLQPVTLGKIIILQNINSPFVVAQEGAPTLQQVIEALFVLVEPDNNKLRNLLETGKFHQEAYSFGDCIAPDAFIETGSKIGDHIAAEFEPAAPKPQS